jgi:hypothetical protein
VSSHVHICDASSSHSRPLLLAPPAMRALTGKRVTPTLLVMPLRTRLARRRLMNSRPQQGSCTRWRQSEL